MSRGMGKTQRKLLLAVNLERRDWSVSELADRVGIPVRQCRRAVRSLENMGRLVVEDGSVLVVRSRWAPGQVTRWR